MSKSSVPSKKKITLSHLVEMTAGCQRIKLFRAVLLRAPCAWRSGMRLARVAGCPVAISRAQGCALNPGYGRSLPPLCWPPGPTALPTGLHCPRRPSSASAHEFQTLSFPLYCSEEGIGTKRSTKPHSQRHTRHF